MENYKPPIRIIALGRAYRNDKFDPTHSPVFHQLEGLVVDENVSFKDLRDTINLFVKQMFGQECRSRFRPHFFPFTEPSAEIDISCFNCGGKGCGTCKQSGWIEIAGCGMVDPNVFDILGIDSEKYSGYAFGFGIDRAAMLKFHIPDIRLLYDNDIRFLRQFV
jgi:phenylalanyl-tRNA synthetase alpha chain